MKRNTRCQVVVANRWRRQLTHLVKEGLNLLELWLVALCESPTHARAMASRPRREPAG